ncbi:MAG: hypothetical protein IPP46_16865 [Bacteroidetes bacterium]|nr:hypothetical protein [Bacteroidota bacterium]
MDLNGNCIWVKKLWCYKWGKEFPIQMTVDKNGNIYQIGGFSSGGLIDTNSVLDGGFLAKIKSNGDIDYIKK